MKIYDQLWSEAVAALESGKPRLDPHLTDPAHDRRRGLSLIFRLPEAVQGRIANFMDRLAADFPGQYFYRPEELHVTIVTLISASEEWEREFADLEAFRAILNEVLARHQSFKVEFRGVTAAPNAVMIQGYTVDQTLENIRAELRRTFVQRGFPNRLDRRYPNSAAHVTALRFCRAEADWPRLITVLKANRRTDFGAMRVRTLQLVLGDWYASTNTTSTLDEFQLPQKVPAAGAL